MLTSIVVLAMLIAFLGASVGPVLRMWNYGERRSQTYLSARSSLELVARELTPAVVDTRMQFVVMPGEELEEVGAKHIAPNSYAMLWMAPLGERNRLHCVGYYLTREDERQRYRLKRLFIPPTNEDGYHPQLIKEDDPRDEETRTSPTDATWFTRYWDEAAFDDSTPQSLPGAVVSTVADGVIGCWVQCYDLLGNPIPWLKHSKIHPESKLIYNSAAYFQVATTSPFDNDESFVYLAEHDQVMKANRVPAEIEIRLITLDQETLAKGIRIPEMRTEFIDGKTSLDLDASVAAFEDALLDAGITTARTFSTRVKLLNGS